MQNLSRNIRHKSALPGFFERLWPYFRRRLYQTDFGPNRPLPSLQQKKDHRGHLPRLLTFLNFKLYLPLSISVAVMTSICAFVHIFRCAVHSVALVTIFANALVGSYCIHASSIVMTVVSSFVALVHVRVLVRVAVVVLVIVFFLRSVKSFVHVLVVVLVLVALLLLLFLVVWSSCWSLRRALCWTLWWTLVLGKLVLVLSLLLAGSSWTRFWGHFLDWPPGRFVEPLCWWTRLLAVLGIVVSVVAVDGIFVSVVVCLERSSKRAGSFECRKCVFVDFKNQFW